MNKTAANKAWQYQMFGTRQHDLSIGEEVFWWVFAVVCVVALCSYIVRASLLLLPGAAPAFTQRAYGVTIASTFIYMGLITCPIIFGSAYLPQTVLSNYTWLPFWYSFLLCKYLGEFYDVAFHSILGTIIAVLAMVILNSIMGGSNQDTSDNPWYFWIPGVYSPIGSYLLTAGFVYVIFSSRWSVTLKQYCLGSFATWIVSYMTPATNDWQGVIEVDKSLDEGRVTGTVLVIFYAVPLAALSLPVIPCSQGLRHFFSARAQAIDGYEVLARQTVGTLQRIVSYVVDQNTNFDMDSTRMYVQQLGSRRVSMDALRSQARWECFNTATIERNEGLGKISKYLREMRQVLRVLLELLTNHGRHLNLIHSCDPDLRKFTECYSNAVELLTSKASLQKGITASDREAVAKYNAEADAALIGALQKLVKDGSATGTERAFIDGLRTCSYLLANHLNDTIFEDKKWGCFSWIFQYLHDLDPRGLSRDLHLDALRNVISWLTALSWSLWRNSSTCVSAASFVFSPTIGALFDRNLNRMAGVGLGIVLGNLPLMTIKTPNRSETKLIFADTQQLIVYLSVMAVLWALGIYGYLADRATLRMGNPGASYSYACLLWAGFGGSYMLEGLMKNEESEDIQEFEASLFNSVYDNFMACMIVFTVDMSFSKFLHHRVTEEVTDGVTKAVKGIGDIVDSVIAGDGDMSSRSLEDLSDHIAKARFWHAEVRKTDLAWNSLHSAPFKEDLVLALLDRLDRIYVAFWSSMSSAKRLGDEKAIKKVFRSYFGPDYAAVCSAYARRVYQCTKVITKSSTRAADVWRPNYSSIESRKEHTSVPVEEDAQHDSDLQAVEHAIDDSRLSSLSRIQKSRAKLAGHEDENCQARKFLERGAKNYSSIDKTTAGAAHVAVISDILTVQCVLLQVQVLLQEHAYFDSQDNIEIYAPRELDLDDLDDDDDTSPGSDDDADEEEPE